MENENMEFEKVEDVENAEEDFNTLDELSVQYLKSPKVGEEVEFKIKGFKVVKDKNDLEFIFEKNGKQKIATNSLSNVDYGIKIITDTNAVFWINSWSVWGQVKAIAKKLKTMSLKDVELQIIHIADGMIETNRENAWVVRTKIDNTWKRLNRETNEWE